MAAAVLDGRRIGKFCRIRNWCANTIGRALGAASRASQRFHNWQLRTVVGNAARLGAKAMRFKDLFKWSSWSKKRIQYKGKNAGWRVGGWL